MRMRRLELAILSITLAFAFFMGGFFTGRSQSSMGITSTTQSGNGTGTQISVEQKTPFEQPQAQSGSNAAAARDLQLTPQAALPVPEDETASQGTGAPRDSDGKININTATHGELTDLPGIGDVLAARIVDYRVNNGGFAGIEDIRNVSGIGERRYEAIRDMITVG